LTRVVGAVVRVDEVFVEVSGDRVDADVIDQLPRPQWQDDVFAAFAVDENGLVGEVEVDQPRFLELFLAEREPAQELAADPVS
jgi:hypothetical protein